MVRLTNRELLVASGLAVLVTAWALFALVVGPALERLETLNRVIPERRSDLERLAADADEYVALRDSIGDLRAEMDSQDETFELLPFAESLVQECGLTENVLRMKPMMRQALQLESSYHETIVEIEMEKLTLGQLFDFLWKIKSSDVLANTRRLYIKKNSTDAGLLDSTVEISNLKLSQS